LHASDLARAETLSLEVQAAPSHLGLQLHILRAEPVRSTAVVGPVLAVGRDRKCRVRRTMLPKTVMFSMAVDWRKPKNGTYSKRRRGNNPLLMVATSLAAWGS
jgi:hypothetical protein